MRVPMDPSCSEYVFAGNLADNGAMSLLWTALALLAVLALLLFAEYIARTRNIHTELTRKFVHMSVGTFVAFWPFFSSWHEIAAIYRWPVRPGRQFSRCVMMRFFVDNYD